jgi:pimeloyl-ACP methyl ester carboxylesterase
LSTSSIRFKGANLFYSKSGTGKKSLLLFHGFGQDHRAFDCWIEKLQNEYTLYSFDLFFHGQSSWMSKEELEKIDWNKIIHLFLQQEKISEFEIAGFSMGGKFSLATLEAFPDKIKKIILLAPDGIKTSFWYSLATYPIAIRAIFKSMILHPNRLYHLTKMLHSFGLVDKGLLRFVESQMGSEEKRRRVYFSWVYFRKLKFNLSKIASLLNEQLIPLTLIVGKHDKVIQPKNMEAFLGKVNSKQFTVLEAGHNDLIGKAIPFIQKQNDSQC